MATITLDYAGTTNIPLDLNNDDGTAYDLTAKRVTLAIAPSVGASAVVTKASGSGVSSAAVTLDAPVTLGTGTVHILPADFGGSLLMPGLYAYSVWVDAGGTEIHMASGQVSVVGTVSRA